MAPFSVSSSSPASLKRLPTSKAWPPARQPKLDAVFAGRGRRCIPGSAPAAAHSGCSDSDKPRQSSCGSKGSQFRTSRTSQSSAAVWPPLRSFPRCRRLGLRGDYQKIWRQTVGVAQAATKRRRGISPAACRTACAVLALSSRSASTTSRPPRPSKAADCLTISVCKALRGQAGIKIYGLVDGVVVNRVAQLVLDGPAGLSTVFCFCHVGDSVSRSGRASPTSAVGAPK